MRFVLLAAVLALLAGCGHSDRSRFGFELNDLQDKVPSCEKSQCADEIAVLTHALERLPGVTEVVEPEYHAKQITDGASVDGVLKVEYGIDCTTDITLQGRIAELGWTSSVSPLSSLRFDCRTQRAGEDALNAGDMTVPVRPYDREQLAQWGGRGSLKR